MSDIRKSVLQRVREWEAKGGVIPQTPNSNASTPDRPKFTMPFQRRLSSATNVPAPGTPLLQKRSKTEWDEPLTNLVASASVPSQPSSRARANSTIQQQEPGQARSTESGAARATMIARVLAKETASLQRVASPRVVASPWAAVPPRVNPAELPKLQRVEAATVASAEPSRLQRMVKAPAAPPRLKLAALDQPASETPPGSIRMAPLTVKEQVPRGAATNGWHAQFMAGGSENASPSSLAGYKQPLAFGSGQKPSATEEPAPTSPMNLQRYAQSKLPAKKAVVLSVSCSARSSRVDKHADEPAYILSAAQPMGAVNGDQQGSIPAAVPANSILGSAQISSVAESSPQSATDSPSQAQSRRSTRKSVVISVPDSARSSSVEGHADELASVLGTPHLNDANGNQRKPVTSTVTAIDSLTTQGARSRLSTHRSSAISGFVSTRGSVTSIGESRLSDDDEKVLAMPATNSLQQWNLSRHSVAAPVVMGQGITPKPLSVPLMVQQRRSSAPSIPAPSLLGTPRRPVHRTTSDLLTMEIVKRYERGGVSVATNINCSKYSVGGPHASQNYFTGNGRTPPAAEMARLSTLELLQLRSQRQTSFC